VDLWGHLCDHFKKDHEVAEFDLPNNDITEYNDVRYKANADIDAIIHLAAQVRIDTAIKDPLSTFDINVGGTMNILEACRLNDIPKVLFASSSDIYGSAQYTPIDERHPLMSENPYGASKIAAERLCYAYGKTYGINVGILRCFNIYGPGQTAGVIPIFIKKALNGETLTIHGDGYQYRDYVYIDDIVRAYDLMLQLPYGYMANFGTGLRTPVRDIAEVVICTTGSLSRIEYTGTVERPTFDLIASCDDARKIGWKSTVNIKDGITRCVEALK
jgi:UDP-glucose 4-epimerase